MLCVGCSAAIPDPPEPSERAERAPAPVRGRGAWAPRVHDETAEGGAELPVVQRIVRQSFGRFSSCYRSGLRKDPNLAGGITVRFRILPDGMVFEPEDAGSTLHDPDVVACVLHELESLAFPRLTHTLVVTYPISFAPESFGPRDRTAELFVGE